MNDVAFTKLSLLYPTEAAAGYTLNDLLSLYLADNPTFKTLLGVAEYYSPTGGESWNDAAARFWDELVVP